MTRIEKTIEVMARPEQVFAYMDDVRLRGQHMLGMGRGWSFEIISANPTGVGAVYRWTGSMFGYRFHWTEIVTKWVKDTEKAHHSVEGFRVDMSWHLVSQKTGTLVVEEMEYDMSSVLRFRWLGNLLDALFLRRYCSEGIQRDLRHMKAVLEETGRAQAAQSNEESKLLEEPPRPRN